jgi:hypothetical protein
MYLYEALKCAGTGLQKVEKRGRGPLHYLQPVFVERNLMIIIGSLALVAAALELACYTLWIPDPLQKPLELHSLDRQLGKAAYIAAYILSLLRAPLGLLPYLAKLFIFFVLKVRYESAQSTYFREAINMVGDFVNLGITIILIRLAAGESGLQLSTFILYLPVGAELVRLIAERVPITFSVLWQLAPHRCIARGLLARQRSHIFWRWIAYCCARYCRYYALDNTDRAQYVLHALKQRAAHEEDLSKRLAYVQAFRGIPRRYSLRSGKVRDVARGEVFIHDTWTNDPWLLVGMAIRRAPWMFDPRYLRRPFYYMTEANRLATLCVLGYARYSLPYAVFQFGHEIRVARLHLFYALLRRVGVDIEWKVQADGTFQFDQIICWLERRLSRGKKVSEQQYLYSDSKAITDILHTYDANEPIAAIEVASRYTYPLKYVEEVLLDKIRAARAEQEERSRRAMPGFDIMGRSTA